MWNKSLNIFAEKMNYKLQKMKRQTPGQNKDNLCLHAARTLIWRSCAFNRGPMTMPVLDGVCGTSESLFWKRKKSIYCWTRSRPTWTFGESNDQVRDKSESKYQRVQDKSETIEKRLESGLEYYSPRFYRFDWNNNAITDILNQRFKPQQQNNWTKNR